MSTKLFSTRLDNELITSVKEISYKTGQPVQEVVSELLRKGLESDKANDPWLSFIGDLDLGQDFEKALAFKRKKSKTHTAKRKSQVIKNL